MEIPSSLPWREVIPWPKLNSRTHFEKEGMKELKASLKEVGMGQPIAIKLQPEAPHWIIAGERRWRASKGILKELPVHVLDITFAQAIAMNLTENVQSQSLTAMEEARGMVRLIEETGQTQTEIATTLGKTQGWVSNRIRLLRLPMPIQELFDEGAFTQSQARDLLLPFASLPDPKWEAFGAAVGKALLKTFKKVGRGLTEEELRGPASKTAMAMSGWMDRFDYNVDAQETFNSYILIPQKRWKKAPSGTVINYMYGPYPHQKSTRAFDMEWWEHEMHLATAAKAEEDARRKEEIEEGELGMGGTGKDLEWTPALGPIPIGTDVPYEKRHIVYTPVDPEGPKQYNQNRDTLSHGDAQVTRTGNLWADPALIPSDKLVLQEGAGGGSWHQPVVLCTDFAVYEAAVASLSEKRDALVARRLARQVKADIEASGTVSLAKAIPSLLALGTTIEEKDFFTEAAVDLGITSTWEGHQNEHEADLNDFDCLSWAVQLQGYLAGLKAAELKSMAQLLVYRLTRSESGSELNVREHITMSVAFELRETLRRELGKTIEIPAWKPEMTKGSEESEED